MSDAEKHLLQELRFQLAVTRAMLGTLDLDQILYIILSGITHGDGLGFNRAGLFLADEREPVLRLRMAVGPSDDEDDEEMPIDGTGTFELAEIKDVAGLSCGVIKFKIALNLELPQGAKADMSIKGTALYSLKFRTFVDLKMKGTMKIEGEMEQMGMTMEMNMGGELKSEYKVKVLPKSQD